MGWSTSIHVRGVSQDKVLPSIAGITKHDCWLGVSGESWTGIYSHECEESAGQETPKLARALSNALAADCIGICLYEDEFQYWLFHSGKLVDQHPLGAVRQLFQKNREILNLAVNSEARRRMEQALKGKPRQRAWEALGMTEQEFITKASADLARVQTMTSEERETMAELYSRARGKHGEQLMVLCEGIGIRQHEFTYSDFAKPLQEDEFERLHSEMRLEHLEAK